jgi:hypothetical protein
LDEVRPFLTRALAALGGFFAPIAGSIHGALILPELKKAALAALTAGSMVGAAAAALTAVSADGPVIFTTSAASALFTFIVTQALSQLALLQKGDKVTVVPDHPQLGQPIVRDFPPAPAPPPGPDPDSFRAHVEAKVGPGLKPVPMKPGPLA